MRNLYYLSLIVLCFSSCSNNNSGKISQTRKEMLLKTANPEKTYIQLYNTGDSIINFRIKLNGKIFYDMGEIIDAIKKNNSEKNDYYNAWSFVKDNTSHITFFSNENWLYSPMILINSLGFANCGMRAATLCNLWVRLGYTSRVWHLEGHVVPEIFINNNWEMYDPDMAVYYFDNKNKIAGVEELVENPSYITCPLNRFKPSGVEYSDTSRYSKTTANYYATRSNNFLFNWKVDDTDMNLKLEFILPPKSTFVFPAKFENALYSTNNKEIKNYSNSKLTIPSGWAGTIDIPLVIHSIRGQGTLTINGKVFDIESEELKSFINNRHDFIHKIVFDSSHGIVEIIYLVNNAVFKLENTNSLILTGLNIDDIQVNLFQYK